MTTEQVPEWMSTLGRMAMQVEGELNRLKAKAARSNTDELQAITDLLELIEHAAGNGFDCHPDTDDRVIRARAVLRNEYPHGERRDDAPDYRTAQQFHADTAHQKAEAIARRLYPAADAEQIHQIVKAELFRQLGLQ